VTALSLRAAVFNSREGPPFEIGAINARGIMSRILKDEEGESVMKPDLSLFKS